MNDVEASYLFSACAAVNHTNLEGGVIVDNVPAATAILNASNLAPRLNVDSPTVCLAVLEDSACFQEIYPKLVKHGIVILYGDDRHLVKQRLSKSNMFVEVSDSASAVLNT
jgi:hypothetical protein